jgi:sulfite exporter TauE/SafE
LNDVHKSPLYKFIWGGIGVLGLLAIIYFGTRLAGGVALPQISNATGYGLLFLVGLLTGFHCISMCGGFVVSYAANAKNNKASHLLYALGKTLSYTIIGAAFGLLGGFIAFTPMLRGVAGILAGAFLLVFGLNMLGAFPWKIRIRTPKAINRFVAGQKNKSPLIIGLLNGLMIACGPLQAVYIMAAGTGSALEGAKLLFVFGLGTLPVMLGFGLLTSFISSKATHKILKLSGAVVILLAMLMINRGLALTGSGLDVGSLVSAKTGTEATITEGFQTIRMNVTAGGWEPASFALKKGVPVRWVINGKEITGCNNEIVVPKLGLDFKIQPGEQVIEFTPTESGLIPWSCWMGMIQGRFVVSDNGTAGSEPLPALETAKSGGASGGTCGGSCGAATGGSCGAAAGSTCGGAAKTCGCRA